ncbi:MAG TPA: saccharopine dehydrogenase NADP-binding domain-containing protein, partial [Burkholderiaceae bacterium]|nr:saccharopine dehydrogenase NADP-binding domain-containing protein [Burkholderiaceae bacterium]
MKILIIGGYGSFGGRLARLLANEARITLLIAGRSLHKAYRFCESLSGNAGRAALFFDRAGDVEHQLREIMPDLVVDATGPFQLYGGEPYRMLKACLSIGIDYLDFADSAEFVDGFAQFSRQAQECGLFALGGVSSFPVLSGAVVRRLARDMTQVTAISAGVAPSPFATIGVNVVKALASYAGQRAEGLRDGKVEFVYPLTESIRYTIAPPGRLPLRNLRFSLVNVPDQTMLPRAWPGLQSIWIGAATVPEIFHRIFNGLAWLVR